MATLAGIIPPPVAGIYATKYGWLAVLTGEYISYTDALGLLSAAAGGDAEAFETYYSMFMADFGRLAPKAYGAYRAGNLLQAGPPPPEPERPWLPWVIGGAAVLAIGAIYLNKGSKKR